MVRDAALTRKKLLDAATVEFAERGIAGARVDRIAEIAGASKALIYTYFGNKDDLFDAVAGAQVAKVMSANPLDPLDLPGYAARLFDQYQAQPELLRLVTWFSLEKGSQGIPPPLVESNLGKVAAIEAAQQAGRITKKYSAPDILMMTVALSRIGTPEMAMFEPEAGDVKRYRQLIIDAVSALVTPDSADQDRPITD